MVADCFSLLYLWVVVGDILNKEFVIESNLSNKFEQFLHVGSLTGWVSVLPLLEMLSKMFFSLSWLSLSVMEKSSISNV